MSSESIRAGRWVMQLEGYKAFIPTPLPPIPPIDLNGALVQSLSLADRALGRLDGVTSVLPNPDLFVAMYVRHEAVLSSQIEGTQSTLEDVLSYEADDKTSNLPKDVEEVVNYVRAMNHGLNRLKTLPLSNRLIREIHEVLLEDVRGSERSPGEFRRSQNWIGPTGSSLHNASFVPPPPQNLLEAMGELETFIHRRDGLPPLIHVGLMHAQFETIHPFLDGNGRVGRLMITLMLCERQILQAPLLYLSIYLKANRAEYYDRLTAIRNRGDWEGWLLFFLEGVCQVSRAATDTARSILQLREETRSLKLAPSAQALLESLFETPIVNLRRIQAQLDCSYGTASRAVQELEQAGLLVEMTGDKRNRRYRFDPYLKLFATPLPSAEPSFQVPPSITQSQDPPSPPKG